MLGSAQFNRKYQWGSWLRSYPQTPPPTLQPHWSLSVPGQTLCVLESSHLFSLLESTSPHSQPHKLLILWTTLPQAECTCTFLLSLPGLLLGLSLFTTAETSSRAEAGHDCISYSQLDAGVASPALLNVNGCEEGTTFWKLGVKSCLQ